MPSKPKSMREITVKDFSKFIKSHSQVTFSDRLGKRQVNIPIGLTHKIKTLQPSDFRLQIFTTWSFPKRGNWATHKGNYRGNWAPEIPRNLILRYSEPEDTVLDQMCGSGTTLVESLVRFGAAPVAAAVPTSTGGHLGDYGTASSEPASL